MNKYYPYGVWCDNYCMWCDDVVFNTDGANNCNGNCYECEYSTDENNEYDWSVKK